MIVFVRHWARMIRGAPAWSVALTAVAVAAGGYFLSASAPPPPPTQPIAFNHAAMVQAGISCLFCHEDVLRSPSPGMPSVAKCMGCHSVIDTNSPEIQKTKAYYDGGQPIPWVRVNTLPRFVYFSHEVHIDVAGLNCEQCHGDVGEMTVDQPVVRMNMGWCLSCHQKQPNAPQLRDCVICHQ